MQFSSREARRSRSRAPGLLNDDSEEQPWPLGGAERRATAAPPSDGWSPAPPLVLVLVCVQARLSALAAAGVTCSSAHGDEKYVPQDTAVFCGILVLDWLGLSTSSTGRPPAGSSGAALARAHCCFSLQLTVVPHLMSRSAGCFSLQLGWVAGAVRRHVRGRRACSLVSAVRCSGMDVRVMRFTRLCEEGSWSPSACSFDSGSSACPVFYSWCLCVCILVVGRPV
ncbi:uncharacterized protein LOC125534355 isoform X1 [Triticum urartu]|uniref:uncharacterized protein LOC125534355 isoform X1 n=1 Tax=Triticum urartu TaxID=4572 RepID=UPI002042F935|nr:uncharacterized protein LOC125534355 isoform X1 [Triticum urartu]